MEAYAQHLVDRVYSIMCARQTLLILAALCAVCLTHARPDSAGHASLPAPGISFGGIPYGSMSGNVAEYFKRKTPSHGRIASLYSTKIDFKPIEQWLR